MDTSKRRRFEFDDVFILVRTMGPFQVLLYFWVCYTQIPMSIFFQQSLFAYGTPQFHCSDVNSTCPPNKCCYNCTEYEFDGPFTSTVSEWNLLCDRAYIGASIQSSYFAGMLIGSILSGWVADAYGRKLTICISLGLLTLLGFTQAFANSIPLLIFLRFMVGFSLAGCMLTQFVYFVEAVGPKKRTHAGKGQGIFWKLGAWVSVIFAYFIRDWRKFVMFGSLPGLLFFICIWKFPETARWLLAHDKLDEAHKVLVRCGPKKNQTLDETELRELMENIQKDEKIAQKAQKKTTPLDLLKTPKLRRRTIIVCLNWFVVALVYFGFDLYTTQLQGSIYLNYFLMNLIDIPVIFIVWYTFLKFGRRIPFSVYMIMVGVFSFIILAIPKEYPAAITALAILGRSVVWSEFNNIYLMTTELYPTVVRNTAMGLGSMIARVGAILSPFIVMVAQLPGLSITFPVTIFGILAIISGIATLWLPETLYANMHQTIEEAESAKEDFTIPCCGKTKHEEVDQDEIAIKEKFKM